MSELLVRLQMEKRMIEFNTDEDSHTIMLYKLQVERQRGYVGIVCVDIDKLAELHEHKCKLMTQIFMRSIGLPIAH